MRALTKVTALHEGDLVDLEGDLFADPNRENPSFECEYAEVLEVVRETNDCVCVYFDTATIGFPIHHRVWVNAD